ncbi:gamma-glutamylcyclotransferase [Caldichromatium japonicum]|uniref:Gamma-glutamylcyclotransferase family protein n=1 Tax=Caldichromatium japonicum TaxID=2699430 RepID=A0A6G7VGW6_9GAMM|nr:gamma-glutamylcyclotransferase family protein [Caldichromatium japonicum]QIK39234.1 gamma-glutamylcyclotransferase [Caldichromatium japonicum]
MPQRVFVYGTLLPGECNHHLLAGAVHLGPYRTSPGFTLILLDHYPGLIRGGHHAVTGEVYLVNRLILKRLDRLEGYPSEYDRRQLATPYGKAWVYLYRGPSEGRMVIRSGDWRAFVAAWQRRRHSQRLPSSEEFPCLKKVVSPLRSGSAKAF